jgi:type II secretory pathway pseudopilin PulG
MKKNYTAFTIIEISIVILIVSLVMAMVIKSSSSAYEARLKMAQDLTRSSPARNIENLVLWFESTLPESIDDYQASEGQRVTIWHDINPQEFSKNDAASPGLSFSPTYSETLANGLPALEVMKSELLPLRF